MLFKDMEPGLFRRLEGFVLVKVEDPPEDFNAVYLTSGKKIKIEDEEEVENW